MATYNDLLTGGEAEEGGEGGRKKEGKGGTEISKDCTNYVNEGQRVFVFMSV